MEEEGQGGEEQEQNQLGLVEVIPTELLVMIVKRLDTADLLRVASTCHLMRRLVSQYCSPATYEGELRLQRKNKWVIQWAPMYGVLSKGTLRISYARVPATTF